MRSTEYPHTTKVEVPAFLNDEEGHRCVFWVDLIRGDRVRVISEFRAADGVVQRCQGWLGEDDSMSWEDT